MAQKNELQKEWEKISKKIYCINLRENYTRKEACKKIFQEWGIPVKFFPAIKNSNGNLGCLLSHKTLYEKGLKKCIKNMIIFEDDIIPTSSLTIKNLKKINTFSCIYPYDIFFLGVVPDIRTKTTTQIWDDIYAVNGICTHAYVISRNGMKKLKDIQYSPEKPLDYIIRDMHGLKCCMFYPSLFHQETGYHFPRYMISGFMRWVEWYSVYINIPLKIMGIFLGIIIVIVFMIKIMKTPGKIPE
jgi:GR25 family glycosyltransferase involved in LPS biosynthesis